MVPVVECALYSLLGVHHMFCRTKYAAITMSPIQPMAPSHTPNTYKGHPTPGIHWCAWHQRALVAIIDASYNSRRVPLLEGCLSCLSCCGTMYDGTIHHGPLSQSGGTWCVGRRGVSGGGKEGCRSCVCVCVCVCVCAFCKCTIYSVHNTPTLPSHPHHTQLRHLCQFDNWVEATILPPYHPSAAERSNPKLYAANVRGLYAKTLKLPLVNQSQSDFRCVVLQEPSCYGCNGPLVMGVMALGHQF